MEWNILYSSQLDSLLDWVSGLLTEFLLTQSIKMDKERSDDKYIMGIEAYKSRISDIIGRVNDESTEFVKLLAIEEVEQLRLNIRSNERRHRFVVEGESIEVEANEVLR